MKAILILTLLFSFKAFSQAHDDEFVCTPPDPTWSTTKVFLWAKEMDKLGDRAMRQVKQKDPKKELTTLVSEGCYEKLTEDAWKKRRARIDQGLALAMTQAQKCWSTIGFAEMKGILTKLRHAKINCTEDMSKNAMATASMQNEELATTNHHYDINVRPSALDKITPTEIAATFFHEALHWTGANNRTWHSESEKHANKGCDNSIYLDRVYLMEAACFPLSEGGKDFYDEKKGAHLCPEVCQKSLTESDTNPMGEGILELNGGERLEGMNYPKEEAKLICEKIRQVPANYRAAGKKRLNRMKRNGRLYMWLEDQLGKGPKAEELKALALSTFDVSELGHSPDHNLETIKHDFAQKKEQFKKALVQFCALDLKEDKSITFCKSYGPKTNPLLSEMEKIPQELEKIDLKNFNLYGTSKK